MEVDYPIAIAILASYFALIFFLLWRILPTLTNSPSQNPTSSLLFIVLSLISFYATWTYMFKFFFHSYREWKTVSGYFGDVTLNSISHWLENVSLFDSAWRTVNVGVWPWLWSHQLCTFTVGVWAPILAIEGARRQLPYLWAYMLLGQVVAISTSAALFFAVMISYQPIAKSNPSFTSLYTLCISSVSGIITVVISPYVASTELFMHNLLIMHLLLFLPLINQKYIQISDMKIHVLIISLYIFAAGTNLVIYVNQWLQCIVTTPRSDHIISDLIHQLISTFFAHPAQSSISYDIVCVNVISIAWMLTHVKSYTSRWVYMTILLTPLLSASVTLPLFLATTEYRLLTHLKNE
ncbi:hypothetical protein BDB01DRAFT_846590 [Pilobolus umbonatus]|nr:hypothetical protein BDB01DRAFT_846590 [Pilobolus umbonatus]